MFNDKNEENVIETRLRIVLSQVDAAVAKRDKKLPNITPRLVAASKIKSVSEIIQAYEAGQRHFGENYVTELSEKAYDHKLLEKCKDIKWHFIGHLQSNKITKLLAVPGLYEIETIDSEKVADSVNKQWWKVDGVTPLRVMVQVNCSGEEAKSGIEPENATALVNHILKNCQQLKFTGLMTIGQYFYDVTKGLNPDFLKLRDYRTELCQELGLNEEEVELSMGMSCDFEQAIELGATTVRVGTNIFGPRPPKWMSQVRE